MQMHFWCFIAVYYYYYCYCNNNEATQEKRKINKFPVFRKIFCMSPLPLKTFRIKLQKSLLSLHLVSYFVVPFELILLHLLIPQFFFFCYFSLDFFPSSPTTKTNCIPFSCLGIITVIIWTFICYCSFSLEKRTQNQTMFFGFCLWA